MKCFTRYQIRRFRKFNTKEQLAKDLMSINYYIKIIKFIRQNYADEGLSLPIAVIISGAILINKYGCIGGAILLGCCFLIFLFYWVLWDRFNGYSSDSEKKEKR